MTSSTPVFLALILTRSSIGVGFFLPKLSSVLMVLPVTALMRTAPATPPTGPATAAPKKNPNVPAPAAPSLDLFSPAYSTTSDVAPTVQSTISPLAFVSFPRFAAPSRVARLAANANPRTRSLGFHLSSTAAPRLCLPAFNAFRTPSNAATLSMPPAGPAALPRPDMRVAPKTEP